MGWIAVLALLAAVAAVLVASRRALEVFSLEARAGKVVRARGRLPHELLRELEDVLGRAGATGRLSGHVEAGRVAVRGAHLDEATLQRARNVVGRFPVSRIRQAPRLR